MSQSTKGITREAMTEHALYERLNVQVPFAAQTVPPKCALGGQKWHRYVLLRALDKNATFQLVREALLKASKTAER